MRKFKKIRFLALLFLTIFCTLNWQNNNSYISTFKEIFHFFNLDDLNNKDIGSKLKNEGVLSVHIIDVFKADSIFISLDDKNILVDASEYETRDIVSNYLKKQEVKKIDLVIATHPHSDHIGAMAYILRKFDVGEFFMPEIPDKITPTSKSYISMLKALKEKKIQAKTPHAGENFKIGPMEINILAPCKKYDEMNDNSIVFCLKYMNKKFLFTGDAQKESEYDMLYAGFNLKSDFLKVAHHGSKTSTSDEFLDKVNPSYAAISTSKEHVAKGRSFDPPVFKKLISKDVKVFRTDKNGNIVIKTDGENFNIDTEK